ATYQAMEFCGDTIDKMAMDERITICNMAIEAGGKNGIIAPDEITLNYVNERNIHNKEFSSLFSDTDAKYEATYEFDIAALNPVVALPHSPDNKAYAKDCREMKVDRAYIGSCTGGKITDFIRAAELIEGKKVVIPTFLVPATREVEEQLYNTKLASGSTLAEVFAAAGCEKPAPASCAACLGGPLDTYGRINNSDRCISTTNRNFIGRMGSKSGEVILASPLTVAASALTGFITDPREFI
ncbi:MAG: aconitase family protein, partial [Lentisphaeria bacterium]